MTEQGVHHADILSIERSVQSEDTRCEDRDSFDGEGDDKNTGQLKPICYGTAVAGTIFDQASKQRAKSPRMHYKTP